MDLVRLQPKVLRERANILARSLSITFERLWRLGEVLHVRKKVNVAPQLQKRWKGELDPDWPHLSPWKNHGASLLGVHLWTHEEDDWKQPAWIYWGQIMPDHPDCSLQYSDWVCAQGESRGCHLPCLQPSILYPTVFLYSSYNFTIWWWTTGQVNIQLDDQERVMTKGSYPIWRLVTSWLPQASTLGPTPFNIFTSDLQVIETRECPLIKSADYTKLGETMDMLQGRPVI